jgi:hypothetical protein
MAEDTITISQFSVSRGAAGADSGNDRVGFLNLPQAYAGINRKNMRHTDNKGYPLAYVCEVELVGDTDRGYNMEIFTAPENWVLKNAVRKWHFARLEMLRRAGLDDLGEYAKTLRPYLNVAHYNRDQAGIDSLKPSLNHSNDVTFGTSGDYRASGNPVSPVAMTGGEWTYSEIAHTGYVDIDAGSSSNLGTTNIVDTYSLVLAGDHKVGADTDGKQLFDAVSIMRSYMESRTNPQTGSVNPDSQVQTDPNPLAHLLNDSLSTRETLEIAVDMQKERPPYDPFTSGTTDQLDGNDCLDLVSKCLLSTSQTYVKDKEVIRIPMGLAYVTATASGTISGGGTTPGMRIRLLGIDKCQG